MGVVVGVLDAAFDVLLLKYGTIKRVYTNVCAIASLVHHLASIRFQRLKLARDPRFIEGPLPTLSLFWDPAIVAEAENNRPTAATKGLSSENNTKPSESTQVCPSLEHGMCHRAIQTTDSTSDEFKKWCMLRDRDEIPPNAVVEQKITIMSLLKVVLSPASEPTKYNVCFLRVNCFS